MDELARATSPIIKLRDNWVAVDSSVIKRARKRLIRTITPVQALAATLTGVVDVEDVPYEAIVGASLLKVRDRLQAAATGEPVALPTGLHADLRDYQRRGLTWLAELTSLGLGACLADDMGLGKTITLIALHLHRQELTAPAARRSSSARPPCSATGRRRSAASRRACPYAATTAARATSTACERLRAHDLRHDAQRRRAARRGAVGPRRRRRGAAHQELAVRRGPSPADHPQRRTGGAHRHARRERPHRALVDPRLGDPRPARQPQRLPQGVGRPDRVRPRAHQGAPVRRPDRPVPAASSQVRPRHRARAAGQDRDRPPARADPRAGRPLRDARARVDAPHRGGRRGDPARAGAQAAHRAQADLQPPRPLPAPAQPQAARPLREARAPRRARRHGHRRGRGGPRLHAVRRDGAAARAPPRHHRRTPPAPARRHAGARARARWSPASRPARSRSSCSPSRPAARGSTSPRADHVLHFDRWWNPAVEDQATDRAYRIGQTKPVQVHRFVTQGTIEEKIAELLDPQALHRRLGARQRRDRADRAVRRRAPRPRRAAPIPDDRGTTHPRLPARRGGGSRHLVEQGGAPRGGGGRLRRQGPPHRPRAGPGRGRRLDHRQRRRRGGGRDARATTRTRSR